MPDLKKRSLTGEHSITCSCENSLPLRLVSGHKTPVCSHRTCNNTQWQLTNQNIFNMVATKHPEIWNVSVKFCLRRTIEIAGPLLHTQYYSSPELCEHTPRNCLETATSTMSPHQWPLPDSGLWGQWTACAYRDQNCWAPSLSRGTSLGMASCPGSGRSMSPCRPRPSSDWTCLSPRVDLLQTTGGGGKIFSEKEAWSQGP